MFCKNCGAKIEDNSKFCASCGSEIILETPIENNTPTQEQETIQNPNVESTNNTQAENIENSAPRKKFSGKGIAGFVLSLVGLFIFGIPCGILGVVFSSIAMKETKTKNLRGKGLAIAGLVISIIDIVLTLATL